MNKYRILAETNKNGETLFYIQKKKCLFFWVKTFPSWYALEQLEQAERTINDFIQYDELQKVVKREYIYLK